MAEEIVELQDHYYIHAASARIDDRTRVLKHANTFGVFDRFGGIEAVGNGQFGVFYQDTRFLSRLILRLAGKRPLLLSSSISEDNAVLNVDLMNPETDREDDGDIPHGTLHVLRSQVIWRATCHERLRIHNYGSRPASFDLRLEFGADFADIFEVRGVERERRGERLPTLVEEGAVVFGYDGLDGRRWRTRILFEPAPASLDAGQVVFDVRLTPGAATTLRWCATCHVEPASERPGVAAPSAAAVTTIVPQDYEAAERQAVEALRQARAGEPQLETSNEQFNDWWNRSMADLCLLRTDLDGSSYPYAGVPWFSTPFGRDGLLTAFQCLWLTPEVARGVLLFLAATQADRQDAERDAEPGKILHETRAGEMAVLGEVPFARYYGTVDATPLFVFLAGAYLERTGDAELIESLWPHVERALSWMDTYGDLDGDGFIEYQRQSHRGLVHQGWKDSHDSIFHEDGRPAPGPIALCEVQGYAYAARLAGARLARMLGQAERAGDLREQARLLRSRFDDSFWIERLGTYALALDGQKQPCCVRTSNAGHCLFSGIARASRAARVAGTLTSEAGSSGWGVRTVASTEANYNPLSYHNGSIWPHDNAIVAAGFGRYGLREQAGRILAGLLDASAFLDQHRLPELFCGFSRRKGEGPTLYPTACSPQAWAAASPLLCLQACLGIEIDGGRRKLLFRSPWLPPFVTEIRIRGLQVGDATVDIQLARREQDVGVHLLRRQGRVDVIVQK